MNTLELTIHDMSCGHCVGQVTQALRELDGVIVNGVTVGAARVSYDPAITTPPRIAQAVKDAGYEALVGGRAA